MAYKKRESWTENMDIAKRPVRYLVWCFGCDANLFADSEVCEIFGCRQMSAKKRRIKKEKA